MNVLSLFDGSLGTLTIFWLVLIVVVFIYALYRFLSKCGRIIRDCNSISYPTTEDTLNKTLVGRVILQNVKQGTTDYAEDSLSVSTVAAPYKLNLRLAQSTPSILISLGILGTFLGLSVAILQFDHSSSDTIRTSINSLLSGMGTAFFTSVFGMLFSVVFLLLERTRYNDLCNAVDSLCERTDQAYRQSSEQFFDKRLEKISGQISGLQLSFGDNLDKVFDEKVTPVMTDISKKLENPAQAVVDGLIEEFRNLTSGLSDALTEKVNNKMNDLLEQFILATDAMKEVPVSIDTATTNLLKASGESIESQKAFTDESRLAILLALQDGEKCGCSLMELLKISQPTLSHHMKILCDSDLVVCRKDGKWTYYSISPEGVESFKEMISSYTRYDNSRKCCAAKH